MLNYNFVTGCLSQYNSPCSIVIERSSSKTETFSCTNAIFRKSGSVEISFKLLYLICIQRSLSNAPIFRREIPHQKCIE